MIIGLAGMNITDREMVAEYLITLGFDYKSFVNEIVEELEETSMAVNAENIEKRDNLRMKRHGPSYWAKRVLANVHAENTVVDGFRNKDEVAVFKKRKDFALVGIYSPESVKFSREATKEVADDPKTKDFVQEMELLSEVFKKMDFSLVASEKLNTRKVDEILKQLEKKLS